MKWKWRIRGGVVVVDVYFYGHAAGTLVFSMDDFNIIRNTKPEIIFEERNG